MGDDDKGEKPMQQPVVRVRERVREAPVKPVSPAVRIRERPKAPEPPPSPPVRLRERPRPPLQADAYPLPPGMAKIQRDIEHWRASLPPAVERDPPLPDEWPQGSAVLRGPTHPGYRRYPHVMGEAYEKNPNLSARIVQGRELGRPGHVYVWAWRAMKYVYLGKFKDNAEAHVALKR